MTRACLTESCRVGIAWWGVLTDVSSTGVYNNDSKSARIPRTPCKWPGPGKLTHGLSQCERTCGHCSSGSVSQCGRKCGPQVNTFWSLKKVGTGTSVWQEKNYFVKFDIDNVIIGVDIKFEKGFNWRCRNTSPALLMTPSYHSLENYISTQNRQMVNFPTNNKVCL